MIRQGTRSPLARAALAAFDPEARIPASTFTDRLWTEAHRAGLLPLVAATYTQRHGELPAHVRHKVMVNSVSNVRALAELAVVQSTFDCAGIRWLVFKGPVLSQFVYRVPGVRVYGDIDILVHPQDLEKSMNLLLASGAALLDRNWAHIRRTEQSEISLELPRGTMLDLHWHPISNPIIRASIRLDVRLLFDSVRRVDFGGISVPTLNAIDTACHTSLHATLSGAHQLRWLIDVRECLVAADAHPDALKRRARELGCLLAVEVMVGRVGTHVDAGAQRFLGGGRRSVWSWLVQLVNRFAPLDPSPEQYSGRAVFGSTRITTARSIGASMRALLRARRAGLHRRTPMTSVEILRRDAGTVADQRAWFDVAKSHAPPVLSPVQTSVTNLGGQGDQ